MLTKEEVATRLKASAYPRVTEESIKEKVASVRFVNEDTTVICIIEMKNGFKFIGHSTPADEGNYDEEIGEFYAYENTFKQIWPLEGYLLRDKLSSNKN